jgi:hypothetical protein
MNKRHSTLSIAAVLAASAFALQAGAAGDTSASGSAAGSQQGVPGVELNVGNDASDRGLPGVEMNIGRQGDQRNLDTRAMGAGADTGASSGQASPGSSDTLGAGSGTQMDSGGATTRPLRADRG